MSHRQHECPLAGSRESNTCFLVYGWRKISFKNLKQRINFKFCVKIGKFAGEPLAQLKVVYGEYAMKKSFFNGTGGSRKMCRATQEVGIQKCKGQMQMWTEHEPWCAQIED